MRSKITHLNDPVEVLISDPANNLSKCQVLKLFQPANTEHNCFQTCTIGS